MQRAERTERREFQAELKNGARSISQVKDVFLRAVYFLFLFNVSSICKTINCRHQLTVPLFIEGRAEQRGAEGVISVAASRSGAMRTTRYSMTAR